MNNKLILGDCLEALDNLEPQSVDIVITDPPYGISQLNQDWNKEKIDASIEKSKNSVVGKIPVGMKFNPEDSKNLGCFLSKVSEKLLDKLKPGSFCLVFSQPRSSHRVAVAFEDSGFEFRDQLLWDYGKGQGKAQGVQNFIRKAKYIDEDLKESLIEELNGFKTAQLTPTYESILLFQKPKEGTIVQNYMKYGTGLVDFRKASVSNRFTHSKPSKKEREEAGRHPTLKPVSLIEDLIKVFSREGNIVLDCFSGSGTTGVACVKTNRKYILIEKCEDYYKKSQERLDK
jgi:site-specific DNA-methyltransferase (adenine-specific)